MKERPILFSAQMVRAILAGRKTQTRRVIKNVLGNNCMVIQKPTRTRVGIETHVLDAAERGLCPYGAVGDRLWVREAFAHVEHRAVAYRADGLCGAWCGDGGGGRLLMPHGYIVEVEKTKGPSYGLAKYGGRWKPSIHMPRWASRITLEVTALTVQRLWKVNDADAIAEGIQAFPMQTSSGTYPLYGTSIDQKEMGSSPRIAFEILWCDINGVKSWRDNPWVWVVTFKVLEPKGVRRSGQQEEELLGRPGGIMSVDAPAAGSAGAVLDRTYQKPLPGETSEAYWQRVHDYETAHGITPEMLSGGLRWPTPRDGER
jgi:hypothetical protein